jgi:AAA family ATP:ADP antiporter
MGSKLSRFLDLREGELPILAQAFGALFLIIAAHTTLETARDAIFLTKLPPAELNVVYVAIAGLTLATTTAIVNLARRFGRRNALVCNLVVAAFVTTLLYFVATSPQGARALYLFSGLVGAMLAPQFWLLASHVFTVAQGRRLFGPIAAGGIVGGTAGAALSALALRAFPVQALLPLAAALFLVTALFLTTFEVDQPSTSPAPPAPTKRPTTLVRENPFLLRIAGMVAISTAAVLIVDYLFKATAVRHVPPARLGDFFARYYAGMNGLSLVVQVLLAGRVIRRFGVIASAGIMPMFLLGGGAATVLGGGLLLLVLGLKTVDGGLRYSVHRVATELLYLPLPEEARDHGKGLVDGVLGRVVQAVTAIFLYVLAMRSLATPRLLALGVTLLAAGWLAMAASLRRPYLDLFRRALAAGHIGPHVEIQELDLPSAEALVETMASPDPAAVVAAIDVLVQHRRVKLVPALVLYHDAPQVLVHALEVLGESPRTDWVPLAMKLLSHPREPVRIAAVRALAKKGHFEALEQAAADLSSRVQAYANFHLALRDAETPLTEHPLIDVILHMPGDIGRAYRRGLLAAASDAPDERSVDLLLALARKPDLEADEDATTQLARAFGVVKSERFLPVMVTHLATREGREGIRDALVAMGDPALDALDRALRGEETPRRVRLHIPQSISRFGSQRAADILSDAVVNQKDGLVRYKALRALGQLVTSGGVRIDRVRMEEAAKRNLEEHLRLLSFRAALAGGRMEDEAGRLLAGLLDDKLRQSMERVFRLLNVAHPREDIRRVHAAALSNDARARANAGEFLDALLARRDQQALRDLIRIVVDFATDTERVARAAGEGRVLARTRPAALRMLVEDHDDALAALAAQHALAIDTDGQLRRARGACQRATSVAARDARVPLRPAVHRRLRAGGGRWLRRSKPPASHARSSSRRSPGRRRG